jgi:hypothetical protein
MSEQQLGVVFAQFRHNDFDQQFGAPLDTLIAAKPRYLDVIVFEDIDLDPLSNDRRFDR